MQVIDGVTPVILCVPTETGETHANVTPRNLWEKKYFIIILLLLCIYFD